MRNLLIALLSSIILFSCSSEKKQIQSWSQWRGPKLNSTSDEIGLDVSKLDSSNIAWMKNVGFGHSAISTSGEYCYISGWDEVIGENDTVAASTIYCLDIETGSEVWSYTYPAAKRNFPGPRSTPVISDGKLYSLGWEGKLFCLNSKSGEELWSRDLTTDSIAIVDTWGYCPSPVVYNNLLLFNLNKTGLAIDKNTGDVVWSGEFGVSSWSSAYLVEVEGKTHGIFQADTTMYLVNVDDGTVVSSYKKKSDGAINNDVELLEGNKLYTGDELLQLNGKSLEPLWFNDSISSFFRSAVIHNGFAYQFCDVKRNNLLYCIDVKTGEPKWSEEMNGRWGIISAVGDKLIILTTFGNVIIANASPDKFEILKELQVLSADNKTENFCWVAPTYINGKLFIRNSKGELACINLGE